MNYEKRSESRESRKHCASSFRLFKRSCSCTCFLPFLLSVIINLRDYTLVGTQKFFKSTTFLLPHPFVDEKDKAAKNKMMCVTSLQRIKSSLLILFSLSYFYLIFELLFNKSEVNISNCDILVFS